MTESESTPPRRPDLPWSPLGLVIIAATLAIDQATKAWAERTLTLGEQIDILPILSLYRVHNTGIAFSLFNDFGSLSLVVFVVIVIAFVLLIWAKTQEGGRLAAVGYALIVGGALGNLVDRVIYGHVVDFLFLHLGSYPLFVFNLADAALTCGPAIMILVYLLPAGRTSDRAS